MLLQRPARPSRDAPFHAVDSHLGVAAASHAVVVHTRTVVHTRVVEAPCHVQAEGRSHVEEDRSPDQGHPVYPARLGHTLVLAHPHAATCPVDDRPGLGGHSPVVVLHLTNDQDRHPVDVHLVVVRDSPLAGHHWVLAKTACRNLVAGSAVFGHASANHPEVACWVAHSHSRCCRVEAGHPQDPWDRQPSSCARLEDQPDRQQTSTCGHRRRAPQGVCPVAAQEAFSAALTLEGHAHHHLCVAVGCAVQSTHLEDRLAAGGLHTSQCHEDPLAVLPALQMEGQAAVTPAGPLDSLGRLLLELCQAGCGAEALRLPWAAKRRLLEMHGLCSGTSACLTVTGKAFLAVPASLAGCEIANALVSVTAPLSAIAPAIVIAPASVILRACARSPCRLLLLPGLQQGLPHHLHWHWPSHRPPPTLGPPPPLPHRRHRRLRSHQRTRRRLARAGLEAWTHVHRRSRYTVAKDPRRLPFPLLV
mmetsp:Transcript_111855/g.193958  ORF Transcript_111855/g.193958 Transcript_111855/m.193958 type:complete len:475 (-) Transcript_111855:540-1964(-)